MSRTFNNQRPSSGKNFGRLAVRPFNTLEMRGHTLAAEAFVRHNAHDCTYADHEKDFRVLQLFAPGYMHGKLLGVLRLSHRGTVEVDIVRGQGPVTHTGPDCARA